MQDVEEYAIIQPSSDVWDEFVARHANAHALQSAAWAGLKAYVGWLPRLVAIQGQHGIVAGASLLFRRRYGVSVGYVPRGPLLSGEQSIDDLLFTALRRVAKSMRAVLLRIEPNILENAPGTGQLHSAMLLRGMRVADTIQPRSSIHLELGPAPEKLLAAMSKGHRADVRRAAREGVSVRWGAGEAELDTLYSILSDTARRAQFGIHERDYYRAVLAQFGDTARIWVAEQHGQAQAVALTLGWGCEALYLYSGSSEAGLKSGAQHAIQWEVIRWAQECGCESYDFWGIPDALGQASLTQNAELRVQLEEAAKSEALYGVYRFKKGFGGQIVRYMPAYDMVLIPPLYELVRRQLN